MIKLIFDNEDAKKNFGKAFHAEDDPDRSAREIILRGLENGEDPNTLKEYIETIDRRININIDLKNEEFRVGINAEF